MKKSEKKFSVKLKFILIVIACGLICIDGVYMLINYYSKDNSKLIISECINKSFVEDAVFAADTGYFKDSPCNTVYAIDEVADAGLDGILIDARKTKDNKWVCAGTDDLSVLTGEGRNISDCTYYEILNKPLLFSGNNIDNPVVNLLEDVIVKCIENDIKPIIYIHENGNFIEVAELLKTHSALDKAYIMSENYDELLNLQKDCLSANILYKVSVVNDETIDMLRMFKNGRVCFDASIKENDTDMLQKIKKEKYEFSCYNLETSEQLNLYGALGAKEIITNTFAVRKSK